MTDMEHVAPSRQPAGPPPAARARSRPVRCLLVEDSRFDRSLIRYSAERGGVDVDFIDALTLAEARERLAAQDFDLVILDRRLPDGDGLDLPGQLGVGARNAGVPMIMLSGGDAHDLGSVSARAGCVGYIAKQDLSPEGLARAVRRALSRPDGDPDDISEELHMLLDALSNASRVARMKPLASRLMTVVSELRRSLHDAEPTAAAAIEELSELCLMLWLDLDGADREGRASPGLS